jgi:hypothetical protein
MARRAIRRATPHPAAGGSAPTKFLAFCPSDLPVKNLRTLIVVTLVLGCREQ